MPRRKPKPVPGLPPPDHDVRLLKHPATGDGADTGTAVDIETVAAQGHTTAEARWQDPAWLARRLADLHAACRGWGYPIPEAATAEDALLLGPWLVCLATFEADRRGLRSALGAAAASIRPTAGLTGRQVALPWNLGVYLDARTGSRRPVREAQQVGAYVADHLLWQRGVGDPGRAARALCALTAFELTDGVSARAKAKLLGGRGDPLVRQRDDLCRLGRETLGARGSLPLLPIEGRLPPDVDRIAVAAAPLRSTTRAAPPEFVVVVFGLRETSELVPAAAWVGSMGSQAAWGPLLADMRRRGLRPGGVKAIAGLGVGEAALRAVAPEARIVDLGEGEGDSDLSRLSAVARDVARDAANAISCEGRLKDLDEARKCGIVAVAMMKVS